MSYVFLDNDGIARAILLERKLVTVGPMFKGMIRLVWLTNILMTSL